MKLIDKAALLAEIDRQKIGYNTDGKHSVEYNTTRKILNIIDTLEVKEVDLDTEIAKWEESFKHCPASMGYKETAKHFFELGMRFSAIGSDYIEGVRGYYETTTK